MTGPERGWLPGPGDLGAGPRTESPPPVSLSTTGRYADGGSAYRPARRTRLRLARVDPWSVLKVAFVVSLLLVVVGVVAVLTLYATLAGMGVFDVVNRTLADVTGGTGAAAMQLQISLGWVLAMTLLFGLVDVVLLTGLATLAAFGYNLIAGLVGGVEVTLAETD